jgi:glycosyltransferase involved in cell wall biosynthesis
VELSVIIPCLNGGDTLAVQLEALASQQWSERWELIIADGGSTDNSLEIANKYKNCFAAFQIVDASARRGPAFARNIGVTAARSDKLAFCDADDEVASGWIASMGDALTIYDVAYGKFLFDKFNDPRQAEHMAERWKDGLIKGRFLPGGGTGNLGINRWVHQTIGGFDDRLPWNEDADYYWRLQLEGFKLHYVPEAVVQVRVGRVNPSLPHLYRRAKNRAIANFWSYKKYRHLGMLPPEPLKKRFATWLYALRSARACSRSKQERVVWLQQFAQKTGDLVGQLQGRINNPCKPYHPGKKCQLRS